MNVTRSRVVLVKKKTRPLGDRGGATVRVMKRSWAERGESGAASRLFPARSARYPKRRCGAKEEPPSRLRILGLVFVQFAVVISSLIREVRFERSARSPSGASGSGPCASINLFEEGIGAHSRDQGDIAFQIDGDFANFHVGGTAGATQ